MTDKTNDEVADKPLSGMQKVCKLYGSIRTTDNDGVTKTWVWDHVANKAVLESAMPFGSDRHAASERAKWDEIANPKFR